MFDRLKSALAALRPLNQQELERAYLNAAVSRYDLECREREVQQGKFRRSYQAF
ncbi:MAG: hypothetical protein R3D63_02460 [Paracoccaceae bacterium]